MVFLWFVCSSLRSALSNAGCGIRYGKGVSVSPEQQRVYPGRAAWTISNCRIQLSKLDEPNDLELRRFGRRLPRLHSPPVRWQHASKAVRPLQDLLIEAAMSHYKETIMNKTIRYIRLA